MRLYNASGGKPPVFYPDALFLCRIMEAVKTALIFLIAFALDTAAHELAHMAACALLRCRVLGYKILCFRWDGKRRYLTLRGRNHCAFATNDPCKMRIIVGAGPAADALFAAVYAAGGFLARDTAVKWGLGISAAAVVMALVYNLWPGAGGDGMLLFSRDGEKK